MSNERYNQIIDEAYKNYAWKTSMDIDGQLTKEEFILKCKTDPEFSERWGLNIEERELSLKERCDSYMKWSNDPECVEWKTHIENEMGWDYEKPEWVFEQVREQLDKAQFPTKLITVTYKDEKIEVYE